MKLIKGEREGVWRLEEAGYIFSSGVSRGEWDARQTYTKQNDPVCPMCTGVVEMETEIVPVSTGRTITVKIIGCFSCKGMSYIRIPIGVGVPKMYFTRTREEVR